jgi:hypothetical protein
VRVVRVRVLARAEREVRMVVAVVPPVVVAGV